MRIVVTGASGFIGSALCLRLTTAMDEVIAVVRSSSAELVRSPRLRMQVADLSSNGGWDSIVDGVDAVVHLGGMAHRRGVSREDLRRVNVEGTSRLAQAAARAGARFLYVSTAKVYGEVSHASAFDAASALAPGDDYARAKAAAEDAIRAAPGLRWVVLRPPLVYGPGAKANFRRLMQAIASGLPLPLASVSNRRSLIGLENLCDAIEHALRSSAGDGACFPVSDGAVVSTPELCRAIGVALGRRARLFACPLALLDLVPPLRSLTQSFEIDDRAFRDQFAWSPPVTRDDGLRASARWFLGRGTASS